MLELKNTFKALGDGNRIRILASLLSRKELCACQIHEWLGVSGATASKHLNILMRAGFIKSRKNGRWVFYSMNSDHRSLQTLVRWLKKEVTTSLELQEDLQGLEKVTACSLIELRRKQRLKALVS